MRRKMTETVEEHLAKDNIVSKLECLREIMSKTTQATDHKAWRPPGNVMEALAAVDLKVAERENEELRLVEQHLDSEVEQLEQRLEEAVRESSHISLCSLTWWQRWSSQNPESQVTSSPHTLCSSRSHPYLGESKHSWWVRLPVKARQVFSPRARRRVNPLTWSRDSVLWELPRGLPNPAGAWPGWRSRRRRTTWKISVGRRTTTISSAAGSWAWLRLSPESPAMVPVLWMAPTLWLSLTAGPSMSTTVLMMLRVTLLRSLTMELLPTLRLWLWPLPTMPRWKWFAKIYLFIYCNKQLNIKTKK